MGLSYVLSFPFMQRAFLAGVITAFLAAILGLFMVLRRLSLIGDTLSHATLAGVAAGMFFGFYPFYGAIAAAALAALIIEGIRRFFPRYAEISLAIVMSTFVALAVVMISLKKAFNADLFSFLFGSLIAVAPQDVVVVGGAGLVVLGSTLLFFQEFFSISFDEEAARLAGMPVDFLNIYLTLLTAVTVALAVRVVGTLLVAALMVLPPAVGLHLGNSFRGALAFSVATALLAVVVGLYLSFIFDLAPGGTIVLLCAFILLIVLGIKGVKGTWS